MRSPPRFIYRREVNSLTLRWNERLCLFRRRTVDMTICVFILTTSIQKAIAIRSRSKDAEVVLCPHNCRLRINRVYLILVLAPFGMVDTVDPLLRFNNLEDWSMDNAEQNRRSLLRSQTFLHKLYRFHAAGSV